MYFLCRDNQHYSNYSYIGLLHFYARKKTPFCLLGEKYTVLKLETVSVPGRSNMLIVKDVFKNVQFVKNENGKVHSNQM